MPDDLVLHSSGFRALLRSTQVRDLIQEEADALAAEAGPGMDADAHIGTHRVFGGVITATEEARRAEASTTTRALSRALARRARG